MTDIRNKKTSSNTATLLWCGAVGAVLFVVAFLIEGVTRPGYSPMRHVVSLLDLSSQGWEQIANFIVTGLLMLLFAQGVRRALAGEPGSKWVPWLLRLMGIGLIISGIFMPDPTLGYPIGTSSLPNSGSSWHGTVHGISGALLWIVSLSLACFVLSRYFAAQRKKGWRIYSILTGVVVLVSFLAMLATSSQTSGFFADNGGFVERIAGIVAMLWVALCAGYLAKRSRSTS